ncbi:sigma 54-interacting transcriptional regulator [Halomonas sp. GXIMD04776]|uniref:sigma-54 dependent transcriptional regulator n=1 Tax=Halomonas sp. GXIMD04776 TaxID=3415605 RepID=UPI003C8DC4C9
MNTSKDLLIVGAPPIGTKQVSKAMKAYGWSVYHADDIYQISILAEHSSPAVGLLYLTSENLLKITDIENTLVGDSRKWIALIDRDLQENVILSRLIDHLFFAYHIIPIDHKQLECLLNHALSMAYLNCMNTVEGVNESLPEDHEIIGATSTIHKLFKTIDKVANVDAPIYISGESGTGKELTAHAIHKRSTRTEKPFVAVNCGAIPGNLIQSELFGHEKGAFTGACTRRIGRIEAAAGGTLFLDEIGDLPFEMQVNLLRFIENRTIQRLGSLEEISVDVRILSATHSNLEEAVKGGCFREDLYHRLNVIRIDIPPLRERGDDIELLANHFFKKFLNRKSMTVRAFSHDALISLRQYHWPGNVRELINRIRRAMVLCEHRLIRPIDLGLERRRYPRHAITLEQARCLAERDVIQAALARNKDSIQNTAKDLDISRVTLYRLIDKHEICRCCRDNELVCSIKIAK